MGAIKKDEDAGRLTASKRLTLASRVDATLRSLGARLSNHAQAICREDTCLSNSGYEFGCELGTGMPGERGCICPSNAAMMLPASPLCSPILDGPTEPNPTP